MQRILKYGNIQNTSHTTDEKLNISIYKKLYRQDLPEVDYMKQILLQCSVQ